MNVILEPQFLWIMVAIAIILVAILLIVALTFIVIILKNIKNTLLVVRRETELIADDVDELRDRVKSEGFKFWFLFRFLRNIWRRSNKKLK